ncbi:hypothetical protein ES708_03580 [subsurface metagenome]
MAIKVEFSNCTNLLEQAVYKFNLQDVAEPNLYREIMSYKEIPKVTFNHRHVPMVVPDEIWITDTSFRDGQQSRLSYRVEQIVRIFDYLHLFLLVKFQKWTKLSSLFLTFCIPKSSPSCQNLTSDKADSLSGLIRSCILSCSGALGTLNSKLFIKTLR